MATLYILVRFNVHRVGHLEGVFEYLRNTGDVNTVSGVHEYSEVLENPMNTSPFSWSRFPADHVP